MITLYTFGPAFGLPDPSPFVMKAGVLLQMAGREYRTDTGGFRKAPKGKLPYIDDDGEVVADSTLIRWYLEKKYGVDLDRGLSAEQRAVAWAFEKMAEDHLYWALIEERWNDDENFNKGPANFFRSIPAPMRPFVVAMVRRDIRKRLRAHGIGRHARADIIALGARSLAAMADYLGDKPYFMGAEPSGVDASMFAFAAGALCPLFDTPLRAAAGQHDNLKRYAERMMARYYPGHTAGATKQAA